MDPLNDPSRYATENLNDRNGMAQDLVAAGERVWRLRQPTAAGVPA